MTGPDVIVPATTGVLYSHLGLRVVRVTPRRFRRPGVVELAYYTAKGYQGTIRCQVGDDITINTDHVVERPDRG